ncbi:MAG: hypothetical protein PHH14_02680 [Candidatus Margulisbacteria bacterium]|nr:hypothetical protein [Candidatus Margulisiibacteriota bacterium]
MVKSNQSYPEILQRAKIAAELGAAPSSKTLPTFTLREILDNFCKNDEKKSLTLAKSPVLETAIPVRASDIDDYGQLKSGKGKEILQRRDLKAALSELLGKQENDRPIIGKKSLREAIKAIRDGTIEAPSLTLTELLARASKTPATTTIPGYGGTNQARPTNLKDLLTILNTELDEKKVINALIDFGHSLGRTEEPIDYGPELFDLIASKLLDSNDLVVDAAAFALEKMATKNNKELPKLLDVTRHPSLKVRWRMFNLIGNQLLTGTAIDPITANCFVNSLTDHECLVRTIGAQHVAALLSQEGKTGIEMLQQLINTKISKANADQLIEDAQLIKNERSKDTQLKRAQRIAEYAGS